MRLKYYHIAAVLLFLFSVSLTGYSQNKLQNRIDVRNNQLYRVKDKVVIDWDILLNGVELSSNNQLTLTPVIQTATGHNVQLPSVIVNGKQRDKLYRRSLILSGITKDPNVYSVSKAKNKNVIATIPYKTSVPYESWMKNASVYLYEDLCGCAGSTKDQAEKLIADRIGSGRRVNFDDYSPKANFITPAREEKKERSENGEAYLIFEQSKWDIIPNLFNNKAELAKIDKSLNYIKEEPTAIITGISIKAYASPEGPYDNNMMLSKERAKALLDYVQGQYRLPANVKVFSEGYGEDWTRLVDLIKVDPKVENREQILDMIKTVDIFDGREKKIMDLSGGRPYLYMLDKIFPLLRRSDYQIEYTVPAFSVEKGIQLLKTKPSMLSLEEMYLIAHTYEKGSEAYNEVFKIADKIYPKDKVANLNAAAATLLANDYSSAKR
jgi:outer membrane protein OmpA-like peptidoglycan-associated protein